MTRTVGTCKIDLTLTPAVVLITDRSKAAVLVLSVFCDILAARCGAFFHILFVVLLLCLVDPV